MELSNLLNIIDEEHDELVDLLKWGNRPRHKTVETVIVDSIMHLRLLANYYNMNTDRLIVNRLDEIKINGHSSPF